MSENRPVCKKCNDSGFVLVPRGAGKDKVPCPACRPLDVRALEKHTATPSGEKIVTVSRHSAPKKE